MYLGRLGQFSSCDVNEALEFIVVLVGSEIGGLVDVDEQAVERDVADGLLEEDVDDGCWADGAEGAQHQQQLAESRRLAGVVGLCVAAERQLSLVLKTRHRRRVTQLTRRFVAPTALQRCIAYKPRKRFKCSKCRHTDHFVTCLQFHFWSAFSDSALHTALTVPETSL